MNFTKTIINAIKYWVNNKFSGVESQLDNIESQLDEKQPLGNYVSQVEGKGLSTEDYTTEEKEKLAGIDPDSLTLDSDLEEVKTLVGDTSVADQIDAALANSQADWNVNDESNSAYVKNRPFYTGEPMETELFDVCALADAANISWVQVAEGLYQCSSDFDNNNFIFIETPPEVGSDCIVKCNGVSNNFIVQDGTTVEELEDPNFVIIGGTDGITSGNLTQVLILLYPYNLFDASDTSGKYVLWGAMVPSDTAPTELKVLAIQQEIKKIDPKFETDPTVPEWAKTPTKPTYTADEVGAMSKTDPVGTGSFSMGRKSGTTIGSYSHAEGNHTTASGNTSHAEGYYTTASAYYSHAEGQDTTASGDVSHAEGEGTTAQRKSQHVQGEYNVLDTVGSTINRGKYAHIVGNGKSDSARSNAHTLDWNGVPWFQGRPQFGGSSQDNGSQTVMANGDSEIVLTSAGGKKFSITVDDSGALTATEVTA